MVASSSFAQTLSAILLKRIEAGTVILPLLPGSISLGQTALSGVMPESDTVVGAAMRDPLFAAAILGKACSDGAANGDSEGPATLDGAVTAVGEAINGFLTEVTAHPLANSASDEINALVKAQHHHDMCVAHMAKSFATKAEAEDVQGAHLCGLLHDLGRLVVGSHLLSIEQDMLTRGRRTFMSESAWLEVVDAIHQPVGTALAKAWQLPESVQQVLANAAEFAADERASPANLARFANAVAIQKGICPGPVVQDETVDATVMVGKSMLSFDDDVIEMVLGEAKDAAKQAG